MGSYPYRHNTCKQTVPGDFMTAVCMYVCVCVCVSLCVIQILTVDEQGVMSVFSLKAGALLATKTVGKGRVVKIAAVLAR